MIAPLARLLARPRRAAAPAPGPTITKPRESVTVLCTVLLDRDRSTPWNEVYRAKSDTTVGREYEVRHDVTANTWTCQCTGASFGHACRHIARSKRLRAVQWWHANLLGFGPQQLRIERERITARVAEGHGNTDDLEALDAIGLLLGERAGQVLHV